jgi:hypothetical protein
MCSIIYGFQDIQNYFGFLPYSGLLYFSMCSVIYSFKSVQCRVVFYIFITIIMVFNAVIICRTDSFVNNFTCVKETENFTRAIYLKHLRHMQQETGRKKI